MNVLRKWGLHTNYFAPDLLEIYMGERAAARWGDGRGKGYKRGQLFLSVPLFSFIIVPIFPLPIYIYLIFLFFQRTIPLKITVISLTFYFFIYTF